VIALATSAVHDVGAIADAGPMTLILPLGLLVIVLTWGWFRTRHRSR
jgi:hypothetical protein